MIEVLTDVAALWPIVLPVMLFALWRTARWYGVGSAFYSRFRKERIGSWVKITAKRLCTYFLSLMLI
jgi:hypothetical protein